MKIPNRKIVFVRKNCRVTGNLSRVSTRIATGIAEPEKVFLFKGKHKKQINFLLKTNKEFQNSPTFLQKMLQQKNVLNAENIYLSEIWANLHRSSLSYLF